MFTPDSEVPEDQRAIFDMDDVKAFDKADYGLYPVRCEQWGFLIFVCLDDEAPDLLGELGDLPERLAGFRLDEWRLERRLEYEIAANWKLIAENFMEYYHLPWVHPSLVKVSPMNAHYRWQGTGMYVGFCTTPIASNTESGGWLGLPAIEGLSQDDAVSARFVWLFPNLALNVLPNHIFLMLPRPAGPNRTSETVYLLAHPQSREQAQESDIDALHLVLGRWSIARTSRSSSASRTDSRTPPISAGACATASRSPSTGFRTWRSTACSASGAFPPGIANSASRCSHRVAGDDRGRAGAS